MRSALERAVAARAGYSVVWLSVVWLLAAALLAAALFAGESVWVGVVALVLAAAAGAASLLGRLPLPAGGGLLVGSLVALSAWNGVSIAWSVAPDLSWDELNRGLVYVAFALLGVVLGGLGPRSSRLAATVLAAALGAAILWALAGKAIPALFPDGGRAARLRDPLGYWNALALAADGLLVLALWLAASRSAGRAARAARAGGAVLAFGAVVAVLLSVSRTGLLVGVAGVAVWLALSDDRVGRSLLVLAAALPAVAVAAWAFTRPGLVEDGQTHAARVSAGAWFGVLVLLGAAVAALAADRLAALEVSPRARRTTGRALVAGAVATVVLAAGAAVLVADPAGGGGVSQSPARLGDASLNNRVRWWGEAWELFARDPFRGSGAGTFEVAHRRIQDTFVPAAEPHSLPLQFLAGTGIVGFALFGTLVAAAALAVAGALRRLRGGERDAAAALAVLPVLYLMHALVDYDWNFVAVTAPALLAAGVLASAGRARAATSARPFAALALVAVALASAVSVATPWLAERSLRDVNRQLEAGDFDAAAAAARRARSLDPLSVEPLFKLASVEEQRSRPRAALRAYGRAVGVQPENPETWYALGLYEFDSGDLCDAYVHLNEAYTLDPASRRWKQGGPLDVARDFVNAGRC